MDVLDESESVESDSDELCRQHVKAKVEPSAKQLANWVTKICEVHFLESVKILSQPESVPDHLTKDWLIYRVSTGKVSNLTKHQHGLAKMLKP